MRQYLCCYDRQSLSKQVAETFGSHTGGAQDRGKRTRRDFIVQRHDDGGRAAPEFAVASLGADHREAVFFQGAHETGTGDDR